MSKTNHPSAYPRFIADIGGTNARFAIESAPLQLTQIHSLPTNDYATIAAAINAYLQQVGVSIDTIVDAVIAIANPVTGDFIKMTNHHWQFSIKDLQSELGLQTLLVINDFTAQALAVTEMGAEVLTQIGGEAQAVQGIQDAEDVQALSKSESPNKATRSPIAVIGPGTGLGVSGLIPDSNGRMTALSGEGGHVAFAPCNAVEQRLLNFARQTLASDDGHISAERLLYGAGLPLLYRFFAAEAGISAKDKKPSEVTHGALHDNDVVCREALLCYCGILGNFCADVVLTIGARGGVYIGGGIVPRFIDFLRQSTFRQRFEAKGRFSDYLKPIPIYVVTHPNPGLLGAATALRHALQSRD